jgi:predicted DCC family thiol-disulfide oxidoreductase YuxK
LPDANLSPLIHAFPNILGALDFPAFVEGLVILGAILSVFFAIGKWDKVAAVGIWYVWACLLGRNPLISNPSIPFVGWLLLAHVVIPGAPYGSRAASGRLDPAGKWTLPPLIFLSAWIIMALGYSYSGYTKLVSPSWMDGTALVRVLQNPLARAGLLHNFLLTLPPVFLKLATWGALAIELSFAPLALFRATRPWIWLAMTGLHLGLVTMISFADLTAGMLVLHFFTFDPAWVPPLKVGNARIFYDGRCGLCHRVVRFVLAEDRLVAFRFAPLQSTTFQSALSKAQQIEVPDAVVVETSDGKLLFRSAAVLHILERLGGVWRILSMITRLIPRTLRDAAYNLVARVRYWLFRGTTDACPMMPPTIRVRFDL